MEYYRRGSSDVWDFIREQQLNFHLGNAIKYICRYQHKGNYDDHIKDINKAIHYLENERNHLQYSRNREDLPRYNASNPIVFTGSGVQGGVSDYEFSSTSSTSQAAHSYSGGVQGVFGGGSDVISFGTSEQSELSERVS